MEEIEQYHYEQARAWLEHVARLKHAVDASRDTRDLFEALLDSATGIDYSREHVSGGEYKDRIVETIAKLDEARAQWAANLASYTDEAVDASKRINRLEDAAERRALIAHYVDGKTWERICIMMDYSYENIMLIRRRGVLNMYEFMPMEWKDRIPNAAE